MDKKHKSQFYLFKNFVILVVGALVLYAFCKKQTDGFSLSKIQSALTPNPEWEVHSAFVHRSIFDQPFFYLGHGAQTYAFVSKDGHYVIKFYRHNRASHLLKPLAPLLPPKWRNQLMCTISKRRLKRMKDFTSYKLAYDHLPQETGLLFLHLNKSYNLKQKLIFYDKIGIRHQVDLDQMEFVLQKKAAPFYSSLEKWISSNDIAIAKDGLASLIALLTTRCQKGIFDKDADLKTNFGFVGKAPIQFDIGRFKLDSSRAESNVYKEELVRITDTLCQWLQTRSPELCQFVKEEIAK